MGVACVRTRVEEQQERADEGAEEEGERGEDKEGAGQQRKAKGEKRWRAQIHVGKMDRAQNANGQEAQLDLQAQRASGLAISG